MCRNLSNKTPQFWKQREVSTGKNSQNQTKTELKRQEEVSLKLHFHEDVLDASKTEEIVLEEDLESDRDEGLAEEVRQKFKHLLFDCLCRGLKSPMFLWDVLVQEFLMCSLFMEA